MLQIAWHIPSVLKDKSDIEVSNKISFFNHLTHSRYHSITMARTSNNAALYPLLLNSSDNKHYKWLAFTIETFSA